MCWDNKEKDLNWMNGKEDREIKSLIVKKEDKQREMENWEKVELHH
jgi:hypothetical protein